jgi:predicted transposase YdaD
MVDGISNGPHDALVRAIFGTPANMADELRAALPPQATAHLDLSSLRQLPAHFVDGHLQGSESDLLFSVRAAGRRAFIYVLVEHQSRPDRFMALRLLRYIGRILDAYRRSNPGARRLPAVIPLVLCHDRKPWPYPTDLGALYDLSREARLDLGSLLPDFRFVLDDLATCDVSQLTDRAVSPLVTVALFALKRARHAPYLLTEMLRIAQEFAALERVTAPDEQIAALLHYILRVGHVNPHQLLAFAKAHAGPKLETIMKTAAEQLLEEGEAKGRAEGEIQGQAKTLLKLAQKKFGAVPPEVESAIRSATAEQLDRWIDRVLSSESAEEIVRS